MCQKRLPNQIFFYFLSKQAIKYPHQKGMQIEKCLNTLLEEKRGKKIFKYINFKFIVIKSKWLGFYIYFKSNVIYRFYHWLEWVLSYV